MEKREFIDLLEQGVDSWNFWREKNLDVQVDLSQLSFSEDFSGIDFSGVNLSGSDLSELDFSRANFNGANLSKANLSEAYLTDANLCAANLLGANLKEAHLSNANFRDADLSGANLSGAYLLGTDLSEANLSKANLTFTEVIKANLSGAYLKGANLGQANLIGTDFSRANLRQAYLRNINLIESNLSGADLHGANLIEANLSGTEFYGANLVRANLSNSQAANAQFAFAKFTGVCIEGWQYNETTNFNGVICEFVYSDSIMRKPYPIGRRFTPGEFTKVFQKTFETIDIVICNAIDLEAFVYSFKAIQAEYEDAKIDIQSTEEKGKDIHVVKVSMSPDVDREEIHAEFMKVHELIREALEEKYRTEIRVKETQIVQYQQETQTLRENINNLHNILQQQTEVQKLMAETPKYDLRGSKFGGGFAGDRGTQIGGILNDYSSKQSLDEAAAEIQQLLKQLEETNPTTTETEKMIISAKAADEIKNNPTLKARVIGALKSGGTEAFKEAVDHPLVNVLVAIIEGWMQAE